MGSDLQEVKQNVDVIKCRVVGAEAKSEESMHKQKRDHALLKECLSGALQLMENFAATSSESFDASTHSKSQESLEARIQRLEDSLTEAGMLDEVALSDSNAGIADAVTCAVPIPDLRDAVNELTMKINGQINGKKHMLASEDSEVSPRDDKSASLTKKINGQINRKKHLLASEDSEVKPREDRSASPKAIQKQDVDTASNRSTTVSNRSGNSGNRTPTRCLSPAPSLNGLPADCEEGTKANQKSFTPAIPLSLLANQKSFSPAIPLSLPPGAVTATDAHDTSPPWKRNPRSSSSPRRSNTLTKSSSFAG